MRYTLFEMTDRILSAMESDEVNSINDTVESVAVSKLIQRTYYDMAVDLQLPEHDTTFQLDASGDSSKPCLMTVPTNVIKIHWIKYDNQETGDTYSDYQYVRWKPYDEFLESMGALRERTSGVGSQDLTLNSEGATETFEFLYETDRHPDVYTTSDDYNLIFDAYDSTEDTTLQKSKTLCYGRVYPTFTLDDSFAPDLDPTQFSYFLNRCIARAFAELKQSDNADARGEARVQKIRVQKQKRRVEQVPEVERHLARYGRK